MKVTTKEQYRLDLIEHTKKELLKPKDQQDADRKLFRQSVVSRLEGIITDMLYQPLNTADYAEALDTYFQIHKDLTNR